MEKRNSYNFQTRLSLLGVVGLYLLYLAYAVIRDGNNGVSQLPLWVNLICAGVLAVGGLGTLGYTVKLWRSSAAGKDEASGKDSQS